MWERIWRAALATLDQRGQLDWSMAYLDGSFALAKKGGEKVGATACRWAFTLLAPAPLRSSWLNRRWTPSACLAREDAPSADPRSLWRIEDMIVARSGVPSDADASACASRRSDVRRPAEPSGGRPVVARMYRLPRFLLRSGSAGLLAARLPCR
jgi:hypothetical protein